MSLGLTAFMVALTAFLVVYAIMAPFNELPSTTIDDEYQVAVVVEPTGLFDRIVRPAVRNFLPQTPMSALVKARNNSKVKELLVRSGNPWNIQPEEFFGIRILGAVVGFFGTLGLLFLGVIELLSDAVPVPQPLWMLVGAFVGWWVPKVLLDKEKGKRVKGARQGLPESLDLLVITLNSGMNFQPALAEVVGRLPEGIIREELGRVSADLRAGRPLPTALLDFARRAPSEEVESFCKSVVTSERLGSDVSETLKSQADSARQSYEAALDEKIGKLPTTLFFPILGLMLPALFIVILAPAFSNIAQAF